MRMMSQAPRDKKLIELGTPDLMTSRTNKGLRCLNQRKLLGSVFPGEVIFSMIADSLVVSTSIYMTKS